MRKKNKIETKFKKFDTNKIVKKSIDKKKQKVKKRNKQFSNFIDTGNKELNSYTKAAFIGALVGGVGGLIIGKKIILGIIIGALAGGYISYELNKVDTSKVKKFNI
jgi:hypothetical protein